MKLMFDTNFAHANIWQGVDKHRRAWKEVVGIVYGVLIFSIGIQTGGSVGKNDGDIIFFIQVCFGGLQQDIGGQKCQFAQVVHFVKFRIFGFEMLRSAFCKCRKLLNRTSE